jgi:hypothetical protein
MTYEIDPDAPLGVVPLKENDRIAVNPSPRAAADESLKADR